MSDYQLYLGDCLEYMKSMPNKSVDAVITDPPYGIGKNNIVPGSKSKNMLGELIDYGEFIWDERQIEIVNYIVENFEIVVICGGNYYADILPITSGWAVWDKFAAGPFSDCELIWTSQQRAAKMFRHRWSGMLRDSEFGVTREHPTQKPIALMRWLINNYANPNDTIFDPFMGSGTTGVACMQLGRNFIGCEINPTYFAIAEKRIKQAAAQMLLPLEDK